MKKLTTTLSIINFQLSKNNRLIFTEKTTFFKSFIWKTLLTLIIVNCSLIIVNAQDSTSIRQLNEVVVNATRANQKTGMAFTNVYQKDIKKVNLGQDMPFLLNQLPSVVVSSDAGAGVGYTGIRIRGTDPTRINVTLNGVPYNDSESRGTYWVNMPDLLLLHKVFKCNEE